MTNSLYPKPKGPYSLKELSNVSGASILGNDRVFIRNISSLGNAKKGDITFIDNPKYINDVKNTKACAIIIKKKYLDKLNLKKSFLLTENPYLIYAKIAEYFYPDLHNSTSFFEHEVYTTDKNKYSIKDNFFIGKNVTIGKNNHIGVSATIGPNVIIGENCYIANGVSISNSIIGDNVVINNGTVVGSDGFGFAFNKDNYVKVPQIGIVVIDNDVDIGCNCTIDKGSFHNTKIGRGVKIDNLVHLAHNVQIGEHTVIAGQTGIAGSTKIGKHVMIGGQVGIAGHLNIGNYVKIGAQAGVTKDLVNGSIVSGTPATNLNDYLKQSLLLKKMVKKK